MSENKALSSALSSALVAALGELSNVQKNATNPHFKNRYATLDAILDAVRPVLAKHGLCISQEPITEEGRIGVTTRIVHTSGVSSQSSFLLPVQQNTAQGFGSALTYARRYAVSSILGIAADDDDDGQEASTPKAGTPPKPAPQAKTSPQAKSAPPSKPLEKDERQHAAESENISQLFALMDKDKVEEKEIFDFLVRKGADTRGAENVTDLPAAIIERLVFKWDELMGKEGK